MNIEEIATKIRESIGKRKVQTAKFHLMTYSRDWSPREATDTQLPDIVVRPTSTEDVAKTLKIANEYKIPVVAIGGLTGMGGGAVPINKGIVIDTKGLNSVLEVDTKNFTVTTQTGVTILNLNNELEKYDLWCPHDPESKPSSTVGAAISCDNDGTFGIKYGKMVDFLLNAVIVTGTGEIVRVGHRKAFCTSSGYKLHWLLIGSEGTLGIVTEATLAILPKPETRAVDAFIFPSIEDAAKALMGLLNSGLSVESAHINCKNRLGFYTHAYKTKHGKDPDIPEWAGALLFVSFNGDSEVVNFSNEYSKKIMKLHGGEIVKEREIVDGWWRSKHTLEFEPFLQKWPDSQRIKKFGSADLGIPIGKLEEAYEKYLEFTKKHQIEILGACVYNERPNKVSPSISFAVFVDDSNPDEVKRFYDYVKDMSKMAIDKEGTMSTYIGDGDRLGGFNRYEHGISLDYMWNLKKVFDPNNILNPGKKFKSKWIKED
ncbi:MAG: FAD-binding oxidoreductase [Candidatus Helarchaeota archaeon]|nr:FAD-binding oxidoreductase [Candidatus Helarchaeota archaeon]